MNIIWTKHAEDRQREWERKLGITKREIEDLLSNSEQVVPGDRNTLVAQVRSRNGLLRVPFVEVEKDKKVLTVYWTSKIERYWKEGTYEDTV